MTKPQQPELRRSGRGATDDDSAKLHVDEVGGGGGGPAGPIPEGNRPGRKPRKQQDKPVGPPPTPRIFDEGERRYRFAFERSVLPASILAGVTPWTSGVTVTDEALEVRFGLWRLNTALANVESVEVTGPYQWLKVAGPPHLSLADRGVTFATSTKQGVCIRFKESVRVLDPTGHLRHPAATVTVEDAEELASLIENRAQLAAEHRT